MMDLYDINSLQIDPNQNNLYDLTDSTFILSSLPTLQTTVLPEQEMRIDLVSNAIYGTVDYSDLLLDLNGIDNPLNVRSGDTILYISLDQLDSFRQTPNISTQQRSVLLNSNKSTQTDGNRQSYLENSYQLPPTFLQTPGNPVSISQGNITIAPIL